MFGRQNGGWDETVINPVNPHAEGYDLSVVVATEELTAEALKKSGFSEKDATSPLAVTAAGYASNILLAQLRVAGLLPEGDLDRDVIPLEKFVEGFSEMRDRLSLPSLNQ